MPSLVRRRLTSAETGPALRALSAWTPADVPGGSLHPGDVGWYLRFDDAAVLLWLDEGTPVAVGFLDGPVLRVTAAPGADVGAIAADAEEVLGPGDDWCDGLPMPGWELDQGAPAAAATGWLAGAGRCGLLEPVGTHPDHRGHGYGRDAVLGACAALARRGASAVAVATPAANEAAVALYRSTGFTVVREHHDRVRAGRPA